MALVCSKMDLHTPKGAPNFRDAFQTELDGLRFPSNTRNIAVTNGSGQGEFTGTPGMVLINHVFNIATGTTAALNINFAPMATQNITVQYQMLELQCLVFHFTHFQQLRNQQ